jgi:Mn-containing catalase
MLIIKKLSKMIKEEICDAEKYANCALKYKDEDKALAETFYTLASQELQHMELLHAQVVRLISDYKSKKGEPPVEMQAVYDYVHEEQMDDVREVKVLLSMYKG